MRKNVIRVLLFLVCSFMILSCVQTSVSATRGYSYRAMYGTPLVDGEIDAIWTEAQDAHVRWEYKDYWSSSVPVSTCHVYLMHDDTYIYALAVIHDYSPTIGSGWSAYDSLEIYVDEGYTRLSRAEVTEQFGAGKFPTYTYQLGLPVAGMSQFDMSYGPKGEGCLDELGAYKTIVEDIQCKIIPNQRDSRGTYAIYQMEIKLHPVNEIPSVGYWGIEFMYNDISNGSFINALRWNCDTMTQDGTNAKDDFPYESTISYAQLSFASPGEDVTPDVPLYPVERQTDKPIEKWTEKPTETETEKPAETEKPSETEKITETEKPSETEKEPGSETEKATEKEAGTETEIRPEGTESGGTAQPEKDDPTLGCGSVLATGAIGIALFISLGCILVRKRKD